MTTTDDGLDAGPETAEVAPAHGQARRVLGWVVTGLACALVHLALVVPDEFARLAPGALLRVPAEAVVGAAVLAVLPGRVRTATAAAAGAALGLLTIVKVLDVGFDAVLVRPFDLVLDWVLLRPAVEFLDASLGRAGAVAAVIGVVALAVAVPVLMTLSVLRLARLAAAHRREALAGAGVAGTAWLACAALGAQVVPGLPVASGGAAALAYDHAREVRTSLRDERVFAAQAAVDAFRDTPGDRLLTGLRGKDVVLAFVESYGRDAIEDPQFAPQVDAVLDAGTRQLRAAGLSSRSGFLTSPTAGGGSWLAHATLLSGLWIDNQQRYRTLVGGDRLTLNRAFRRARWRTAAAMPANVRAWPEGRFFGYDKVYDSRNIGYRGPRFSYATMPDQFTLSAIQRSERTRPEPVMVETALVSSHAPWASIPRMVDWSAVGDGSVYRPMVTDENPPWPAHIRTEYRRSIEYSLNSLISYAKTYGDENLVMVFLGDHQPASTITGPGAGRDVPITIVARDPRVLDRISGWGWQDGLRPGPNAPVWPMNAFRDRFLTAFGG
ncbi:sulfatase-like hydrolase/transferase [Actinomadura sp. NEAU-AAG7]|uniref:sulfatase-like hydrolase/transferase n=1 Tax=Actinomadura sp. NEAU-AAG7 TaxID=2839640 RepID=UPI001BE44F2E|nr:sulfatase-like hydrolase/transferase [Actinomadura sp. NEAU-AAG7]MBT2212845.1 sulfatase-like hydrolase/transferase [Actinomadura sp. NEAU-AAG7]